MIETTARMNEFLQDSNESFWDIVWFVDCMQAVSAASVKELVRARTMQRSSVKKSSGINQNKIIAAGVLQEITEQLMV